MKRIIALSLGVLLLMTSTAFSQTTATTMPGSNGLAIDTVSNTGTETWTLKVPAYQKTVAVQFKATKINGTVAGTVTLQCSLNGTDYFAYPSASTFTATDVASQTTGWRIDNSAFLYYRVSWTGSGTMSASGRAWILPRQ